MFQNKLNIRYSHSRKEVWLFLEAVYFLAYARLAISLIPFKYIAPTLGIQTLEMNNSIEAKETLSKAMEIAQAIKRGVRYAPWINVCLPQAIVAQRMLARRKIAYTVYLGTAKDESNSGLKAHAWVKCGDLFIVGKMGHEQFTVISRFVPKIDCVL